MEISQHQMVKNISLTCQSDHSDIESDHELHPIPLVPQAEQGGAAVEAGRGQAQVHGGAKANGQACG